MSCFSTTQMPLASNDEIDVIIPVIPKDLDTLPHCIEGVRKNVSHKIKGIYLVGPNDERLTKYAVDNELHFVNEEGVLGFGPKDIDYTTKDGRNRSGWLFQQFLKLSGKIGECQNFITIDSDHVLLRPHVFITTEGRFVFYRSEEFNWPYIVENHRLLGKCRVPILSYVAHKMVFNKKILEELKNTLEKRSGEKWTDAILHSLDNRYPSAFSEFELYASFVEKKQKTSKLWLQKTLFRGASFDIEQIKQKYPSLLSVTYPEYLKNTKD